jgi:hypothetical protein
MLCVCAAVLTRLNGSGWYRCPFCPRVIKMWSNFDTHYNRHWQLTPHRCREPGCSKASADRAAIVRHAGTKHGHVPVVRASTLKRRAEQAEREASESGSTETTSESMQRSRKRARTVQASPTGQLPATADSPQTHETARRKTPRSRATVQKPKRYTLHDSEPSQVVMVPVDLSLFDRAGDVTLDQVLESADMPRLSISKETFVATPLVPSYTSEPSSLVQPMAEPFVSQSTDAHLDPGFTPFTMDTMTAMCNDISPTPGCNPKLGHCSDPVDPFSELSFEFDFGAATLPFSPDSAWTPSPSSSPGPPQTEFFDISFPIADLEPTSTSSQWSMSPLADAQSTSWSVQPSQASSNTAPSTSAGIDSDNADVNWQEILDTISKAGTSFDDFMSDLYDFCQRSSYQPAISPISSSCSP